MKTDLFSTPIEGPLEYDAKGYWTHPDALEAWESVAGRFERFIDWLRGMGFEVVNMGVMTGTQRVTGPQAMPDFPGWVLVSCRPEGVGIWARQTPQHLKACPFCFGPPKPKQEDTGAFVRCLACGARGPMVGCELPGPEGLMKATRIAVRLWNEHDRRNMDAYVESQAAGACDWPARAKA